MAAAPPPPPPPPGGGTPPPPPGGVPSPGDAPGATTADFGRRLVAWIVDSAIVGVVVFIGNVVVLGIAPRRDPRVCTIGGEPAICESLTGVGVLLVLLWIVVVAVGVLWFWHGSLVGERGVTPGRRVVSIRVVDAATGAPIGRARGIGRAFAALVSAIPLTLGYLWMIWDERGQTWHDKMVGSMVVVDPTV